MSDSRGRSTMTYALCVSENQRAEVRLTPVMRQLTTGGGEPGQGYPCVLIFSVEDSHAKTSVSQDKGKDSKVTDQDSSMNSQESPALFDLSGFSLKTYQDCSPRTAVGTSESCLERWPTSGMAWHGGFSTANTSECRSDDDECSSLVALVDVLEPSVLDKYSLSAKAAIGILRRAEKRGRTLPPHLSVALEAVAQTTTTDKPGG